MLNIRSFFPPFASGSSAAPHAAQPSTPAGASNTECAAPAIATGGPEAEAARVHAPDSITEPGPGPAVEPSPGCAAAPTEQSGWIHMSNASLLINMVTNAVNRLMISDARDEQLATRVAAAELDARAREREKATAAHAMQTGTHLDRQIAVCTTVAELARVCGFKFNAQENLLECELCRSYLVGRQQISNKLVQGINRGELGYFKAEQALKNLKPTVKGHLSSAAHKWAADAAAAEAEAAKAQRNVCLNVARIAYKTIREGDSHVRFEREVSAINLMGLNLGEKNHHRSFVSSFAESAEAVLRSSQRRFLDTPRVETGRRPVFAVNADKLTCMRRTSQLVGIIMIVDGEFIAGMLGCTTCGTNLDGDHTAASLLSVLEDKDFVGLSRERLRKQCVGAAFDGAYFSTHVPSWFCRKLGISEVFLSAIHDPLPFMEDPAQALSAPLDDASSPYCLDTSDATGILHDSDGEGDGPTHKEQGTWRVEEVRKYRFNRQTRRDEWLIKWQGWPERSDTWEPLGHLTSDEVRQAAIKRKEQE